MAEKVKYGSWEELEAQDIRKRRDRIPDSGLIAEDDSDFVTSLHSGIIRYDPDRKKALTLFTKYCK